MKPFEDMLLDLAHAKPEEDSGGLGESATCPKNRKTIKEADP